MKVHFQIAECSFFLFKENANERNESYFQIAECRFFFCKENANERNENLFSDCRVPLFSSAKIMQIEHNTKE